MSHPTLFDDDPGPLVLSNLGIADDLGDRDNLDDVAERQDEDDAIDGETDESETDDDFETDGETDSDSDTDGGFETDGNFEIVLIRSARRKRSVGALLRGNVLQITIPTWMSKIEEEKWIATMSARYRRKQATDRIDLKDRAMTLARRHELPYPREIRWVDDMKSRWGSCTPSSGTIRMSSRLAKFPDWVVDYVLVHELCHLEHADHSPSFWKMVHRYPKAERATGYLIAKSGDVEWED